MHNINQLVLLKKAMDLTLKVYEITKYFPGDERFGLVSQMRRCAISIPSNISEGAGRNTKGEFVQFLGIANGSTYELHTQLLLAERLGFIPIENNKELLNNINELQKMTYNLQKTLKKL